MTGLAAEEDELATTSGTIAMVNLQAQADSLAARVHRASSGQAAAAPAVADQAVLIDLLTVRGHVLGRIADYERAAELAEGLAHDAPDDGMALLARAKTRATFHRFPAALADLDAAGRHGADRATLDAERAAILQAVGCYTDALALHRNAAQRRTGFTALSALAVMQAERGQVTEAERLFAEALRSYRGVSPFPVASLDFRRGLMWLGEGNLPLARAWFDAARRRMPAYAPALGHLAEVDAALGDRQAAIDRLRPLAVSSDDPDYAASLAGVLRDAGQTQEAGRWRASAAARYDELVLCHPEAFTDHAADFWLTVGGGTPRGLQLATRNRAMRQMARAYALHQRASLAKPGSATTSARACSARSWTFPGPT
jgi:tetratricopeptide (TPR) repeat protein